MLGQSLTHKLETAAFVGFVGAHNAQMWKIPQKVILCAFKASNIQGLNVLQADMRDYITPSVFKKTVKPHIKSTFLGHVMFKETTKPEVLQRLKSVFCRGRLASGAIWAIGTAIALFSADGIYSYFKGRN